MQATRLEIIKSLKKSESRSFSELLSDAAETSDNLTYHLKYLIREKYIASPNKGLYELSRRGKLFTNSNLDRSDADLMPTASIMLIIDDDKGNRLLMRKHELPHINKLHNVTFQLKSSQTVHECIDEFCNTFSLKINDIRYVSLFRKRSHGEDSIDFDKLFLVHRAKLVDFVPCVDERKFELMPSVLMNISDEVLVSARDTAVFMDSPLPYVEKLYKIGE